MYWAYFCDNPLTITIYLGTANMDLYFQGNKIPTAEDWDVSMFAHVSCLLTCAIKVNNSSAYVHHQDNASIVYACVCMQVNAKMSTS